MTMGINRLAVRAVAKGLGQANATRALAASSPPTWFQSSTPTHFRFSTPSRVIGGARYGIDTNNEDVPRHFYSTSSNTVPLKSCPNCGQTQALESLSCPSCNTLQPLPSDIDFFKVMDLDFASLPKGGWEVDIAALKRAWRLKMALTHPDRMVGRTDKEQQIGAQQSALINRAYETLLDPLPRAHYLLERHGAAEVSESDSLEDPELLMEVMELRERLEEAGSEEEAAEVREDNKRMLDATVERLAHAFAEQPPDLESAREAAVQLRYWTNIEKAAREWSPGKRVELQH